uniref:Rhomboid-like protein n=1 Tax=Lotharella globosa TaxID=91324 RepID=A0A7S3Z0Y4_9EUKA|eukprot:CAMPEP_0167790978 /NCGR_PEP_ID=MMETSP0111_2-20121227/11642_1 /TAXON_ID=91324 /ORGANISM="Lotharella globosa, Strain CCCM811" /LENGTH=347 /DNA_ID=CAMNT_0007683519 /DNA_START=11 /DNA_END=1054 /DNA_ORIENTATION=+
MPVADPELQATLSTRVIKSPQGKIHVALTACLFLLCLLGVTKPSSAEYFAMIPFNTAIGKFRAWNLLTSAYYDNSIVMGCINTAVAFIVGRMLERKWKLEFAKFLAVINLATMLTIFIIMVACYASTTDMKFLLSPVCGFSAANAAFGVALKQLAPNQNCVASFDKIKFKHLPAIVIACAVVCYGLGVTQFKDLLLVVFGTYYGWLYLRYFMPYPGNAIRGDSSEEFAFKTLWPGPLRPIGAMFGNITFGCCEMCGFCKVVDGPVAEELPRTAIPSTSIPIPEVPDTVSEAERKQSERRRALAVKAINERIEQLKQARSSAQNKAKAMETSPPDAPAEGNGGGADNV